MQIMSCYGPEREEKRVVDTLKRMPWYTAHGYEPRLPEGISVHSTREEIHESIQKVFREEIYEAAAAQIGAAVENLQDVFALELEKLFPGMVPAQISVILTQYGVGGSYVVPDALFYNIHAAYGVHTVFHEIVHLCLEPLVQKYALTQWEKERMVDLILHLPAFTCVRRPWQRTYHGVEAYVDEVFHELFLADKEECCRRICGERERCMQ